MPLFFSCGPEDNDVGGSLQALQEVDKVALLDTIVQGCQNVVSTVSGGSLTLTISDDTKTKIRQAMDRSLSGVVVQRVVSTQIITEIYTETCGTMNLTNENIVHLASRMGSVLCQ